MQHSPGKRSAALAAAAILLACASAARAHHSTAEYDAGKFVEARGEVVSVLWRNPHVRFQVSTKSVDGNDRLWDIESADLTRLDRAGLPRDLLRVGDTVSFAGNPSKRNDRRMYVTNLLVADGREILLRGNVQPRWAAARAVDTEARPPTPAAAAAATASAGKGFFGKVFVPTRAGQAPAWVSNPPLTQAAAAGKAAYDEVVDDPVLGCVSPGMPRVMLRSGPYAVRFVERGADLVLQNEWFEIDRLIHMDGKEPPAGAPYTPLGYSAGKWDGDALVIATTHIDWPYFELYGLVGVPQSREMRLMERFTPRDGGATLRYDFSATDPNAFTETVSYENYVTFRVQPGLEFLPYDCVETERKARGAR
ncbi:MAG TPA: DUF6152 family protein [Gammaproteobacteria bacterium]|nr:DUF6152 family protein [Gammaproteobacteria bacterium]